MNDVVNVVLRRKTVIMHTNQFVLFMCVDCGGVLEYYIYLDDRDQQEYLHRSLQTHKRCLCVRTGRLNSLLAREKGNSAGMEGKELR